MNKQLILEKYIKVAVRKALKEQEEQQKRAEKALYTIYRFPGLKKLMEDLMSPVFGRFIGHIDIVAPKPTTFNVKLINNQDFTIVYVGKGNFTVKISGKKYNPLNLGELERASQSIADLLQLNYAPEEGKDQQPPSEEGIKADLEQGGAEAPPPEAPEEAPAEEETPPVAESLKKKVKTLNEIYMSVLNEDIDDDILDALVNIDDQDTKEKVLSYLQKVNKKEDKEEDKTENNIIKKLEAKNLTDNLADLIILYAKKSGDLQNLSDYLDKPTVTNDDLVNNNDLNSLFSSIELSDSFKNKIINLSGAVSNVTFGKGEIALIVFLKDAEKYKSNKTSKGDIKIGEHVIEVKRGDSIIASAANISRATKSNLFSSEKAKSFIEKYNIDLTKKETWISQITSANADENEIKDIIKDLYSGLDLNLNDIDVNNANALNTAIGLALAKGYLENKDLLFINKQNEYICTEDYSAFEKSIQNGTIKFNLASDIIPRAVYKGQPEITENQYKYGLKLV